MTGRSRVLLDTNIAIGLIIQYPEITQTLNLLHSNGISFCMSVISKCELLSGAKNDIEIDQIINLGNENFVEVNNEIAQIAGAIRREQKQKQGRALKTPDALIIATAKHHGFALYTKDKGMHFIEEYGVALIK
ncbi:PIN domain-containing protein [Paenibacillus alginolyticus]|uniref:PIN domain-containing protein n=1 Tax=Paenibacillus alginolyticus TaxID=59839 RepID=UPI000420C490|nr:PIN domain-containing protein [Paenibacillus alginolyticus]MCY9663653.1 PIN domain-containing protein [Paenibacillus alginolyticus]